ncbi:hypothetical protein GCM10010233_44610 [Streptomyces pseudogriseolus]|nr:hypothetical protein GCM10010233_44610 [Streptomyces gancidicus]
MWPRRATLTNATVLTVRLPWEGRGDTTAGRSWSRLPAVLSQAGEGRADPSHSSFVLSRLSVGAFAFPSATGQPRDL